MFGEYAQSWLNSLEVVHDTRVNDKGLMNNYWMPHLATLPIKAVTPMVLREVVAKTEWKSSTVKRAAIARVKAMFRAAVYDELVDRNPTAREIAHYRSKQKRRVSTESLFVFQPSGSSPHISVPDTAGNHFNQAIEAMGFRRRPQYNCRHTYATMCLMSGMNPAFIAGQLGHSIQVLLTTYAKWLNSANDWSELAKLEKQVIGTKLVQD